MKKSKKILLALSATLALGLSAGAMTACGEEESIKISFDTDGGAKISSITVKEGKTYALPEPAAREGYSFDGWYATSDFSGSPVTEVVAGGKSTTYYAKWTQLAKITLLINGGELENETLYLKEGANVAEFMKDYVPTKSGLTFGAWFDGETELDANKKMPANGLTLTAKYKVNYTVKLMLESLSGGTYEEKQETLSDYVEKNLTVSVAPEGFTEIAHDGTHKTAVLSENASENVFTVYYSRNSYELKFRPNYPDGALGNETTINKKYDAEFEIPSDYSCQGYALVGWATTVNGEAEYLTNQIERLVFNESDGEKPAAATMKMPAENATLYAVWQKGCVDMFGGSDSIYFLDEDSSVIYLSRGGVFFKGVYDATIETFYFDAANGDTLLEGKMYDGDLFAYSSGTRNDMWSTLYENGVGLAEGTRIDFDEYNGIEYTTGLDGNESKTSSGTYEINEDGYYVATFTEGELQGKEMTLVVGYVTVNGVRKNAFQIRNEEEIELGTIVGYKVIDGVLAQDSNGYSVTLNGFGVAHVTQGSSAGNYYYTITDEILTLTSRYGSTLLTARLVKQGKSTVYVAYAQALDNEFEIGDGSLVLDGASSAVYTQNGSTKEGVFVTIGASAFGGTIVDVLLGEETYRIVVSSTDRTVIEDGEAVTVTDYKATEKLADYAEYYYLDDGLVYYAPMIVFDEEEAGIAILYGIESETQEYVVVSKGTYALENGRYIYTVLPDYVIDAEATANLLTEPFDLTKIKSIVFDIDVDSTAYRVAYWYSSTDIENVNTPYEVSYTSSKADGATLELVSGFAFYKAANEITYEGAYVIEENVMTIYAGSNTCYIRIDEENKQFLALDYAPYDAYLVTDDGMISKVDYLSFDGAGNATRVTLTLDEDGNELSRVTKEGVVSDSKKVTDYNMPIWSFTSTEKDASFDYIRVSMSSRYYIIPYNADYAGTYESTAGRLTLDGYIYGAKFIDKNRNEYEGNYVVIEENVVQMNVEDGKSFYFDLSGDSFTVRGEEYGEYALTENQYFSTYVELDGYGKLSVYTKDEDGKKTYISEDGTYEAKGDGYVLSYVVGNTTVTHTGKLGTTLTDDDKIPAFILEKGQKAYVYVNEADWSMLLLDDFGGATKYGNEGEKEEGRYTIVTESLFYYTSEDQSSATLYFYDADNGVITPVDYAQKSYYTANFESLLFTQYGFAVFNDTLTYYYSVDENDNVTIYRQDPTAKEANVYGFVAEDFGKFDKNKNWTVGGVEKEYIESEGNTIIFSRSDGVESGEGDDKTVTYPYPVALTGDVKHAIQELKFKPSSKTEFSVEGDVVYNGKEYDCTVTREIVNKETGETALYVTIDGYYYRFYINAVYNGKGEVSTYEVVDLTFYRELPSYNYLYTYYVYAMFYGTLIENEVGIVTVHGNYNELGEETGFSVSGEFFEGSEYYDQNGELLTFENGSYEYDENESSYSTTFVGADGETYSFHFIARYFQNLGVYGYNVYALTSHQQVKVGEYTVDVQNVLKTELTNVEEGDFWSVGLYRNDTELKADELFKIDNAYYYVVRETDGNGKITGITYYQITLKELEGESVGGSSVPTYESATVTSETATKKYSKDGKLSVDIAAERDAVLMICLINKNYYATGSVYDAETSTYTVTTTEGKTFLVKVDAAEGTVEISEKVDNA
ncbi:MAG: InlB B-repeat-containing protein [Clostridia bacterium]|nr:InlB B-repeat-containing protein [Clostridia bacterium]